ncbi:cholesterol oxidase [Mycobacterium xenopi 4042]|uniref:Cholesterol oxidase n=1 Tax=Mycobacterium xenopi 4042 TaxID=1299334 RepID=X7YI71_MYCXE|nr:cholesterol oxidase [Mycobacterium xenopi 4042]
MTGCRHGAKNTLVKNYLGLAESAGAQVIPMTTVTGFEQLADGTWQVRAVRTGRWVRRQKKTFTATYLVLAAGTWGTQRLLFKMRDKGKLPKLSDRLGVLTRTNSESIVGAGKLEVSPDLDLTHGVAITSSIHPTPDTHIEPVRYGKGSNAMGLLQTLMTDGPGPEGTDVPRWRQLIQNVRKDPRGTLRLLNVHRWSERTLIALVMQHLDNSITTFTKRGMFGRRRYSSKQGHGEPNPTWIPIGNKVTGGSPRRSTASPAAPGASCSTSR